MNSARLSWPPAVPRFIWIRRKCPLCSSIEFKSAEREWLDVFFRLLSLRPIRCVNCWRRYYSFQNADATQQDHPIQGNRIDVQAGSTKGKSN
jgi:hypothetical protein